MIETAMKWVQSCDDSRKDYSVDWEEYFFVTKDGVFGYAYFPITEIELMNQWHDCFLNLNGRQSAGP